MVSGHMEGMGDATPGCASVWSCFLVSLFPGHERAGHGAGEVSVFFPSVLTQWKPQWSEGVGGRES